MSMTRAKARSSALAFALAIGTCVAVGSIPARSASAATPTWTAAGSARQVYVTGATPAAQMSLLTSAGHAVATQTVDSLGAALFRNVTPGTGYHVRNNAD